MHDPATAAAFADMLTTICLTPEQRTAIQKPPFPWFGGKSRVAPLVWSRLGPVGNYVEPFFGSGAVLFHRPHPPGIETVNDKDCYLANFWRATQQDPEAVAHYANAPVNEADLSARHLWLVQQLDFQDRMKTDPDFYDSKIAGWWVWGLSAWIGQGWCRQDGASGHWQKLPHLGDAGRGVHRPGSSLFEYFSAFTARLRSVRVCCGDWSRVLGDSVTVKQGLTGVFLDPPYSAEAGRDNTLYAVEDLTVAHAVRDWALAHGHNPLLRIALCGYAGEHDMPTSWSKVNWKANGGMGNQSTGRGRANAAREVVWFSPSCLAVTQPSLFVM